MEESLGKLKCFSRVQIVNEDGSLAGDSGWTGPNMITNLGIQLFLAGQLAGTSHPVAYCALGTGGAPASNAVTLPGEVSSSTSRVTVSKSYASRTASDGKGTQYFYATFAAGFVTEALTPISNIGLYAATTSDDTLFCGNVYTSSNCAANQACNITYQIQIG